MATSGLRIGFMAKASSSKRSGNPIFSRGKNHGMMVFKKPGGDNHGKKQSR
jgi:hypothetical protein